MSLVKGVRVNSRPASVVYLNKEDDPVEPNDPSAVLVKVNFTDDEGGVAFLRVPTKKGE